MPAEKKSSPKKQTISRRSFLGTTAAIVGATTFGFPAIVRGQNLNSKLDIAIIGSGGRGGAKTSAIFLPTPYMQFAYK